MNCPGSIQLAKRLGIFGSKSGLAAKEGTAAHEVLARCLENDMQHEPWEFLGTTVTVESDVFTVDQDMANSLNLCFNHVMKNLSEAEAFGKVLKFIEVSMHHSKHELMFGTTDCGIVAIMPSTRRVKIWINDLKYGAGITVEPTSSQTKYYACLIVDRLFQDKIIESWGDVEEIIMSIMQPRIPHPDGLIRTVSMTGAELKEWYEEELIPAMEETENPDAILKMGEWCTFCPAKDRCPAIASAMIQLSTAKPPEEMTGEELGDTINKIKAIEKLKEKYERIALERALKGERIGGFKLVKKRANRVWKTEAEKALVAKYGTDAYNIELKGPPAIEDMPDGGIFVAEYAYSPDTGLTLAPSSDKRKESKPLMRAFDDYERGLEG